MKDKTIPLFVIEEHHEAFRVWHQAIAEGYMPSEGNCLLHVDEHDDMEGGQFRESLLFLNGDLKKVEKFTYEELNIANFIIPACYCGIVNRIYWVRQNRKTAGESTRMYVRSYNQAGKKLIFGKARPLGESCAIYDRRLFDYSFISVEAMPSLKKVILDIDLDYFSCVRNPRVSNETKIEITKDEYDSFILNRYHRLNYLGLTKVEAICEEEKCYYVINNFEEVYPSDLEVDEAEIKRRIENLVFFLQEKEIYPVLIDICRSRYSGYTPQDHWEYIENTLIGELSKVYKLERKVLLPQKANG